MNDKELTYDDFLQRLDIRDILIDAGYRQNRRDGLRYPSYVRLDSNGQRIRGDKFIITQQGKGCSQPPRQKEYNVISFIKEHPHLFAEYREGINPHRLVELVCYRLLHYPIPERETRTVQPQQDIRPFDIADYDIQKFYPQDRGMQEKFAPYFENWGIDLCTQQAFHRDFCLATKHREDGARYTNLSFPLTLPKGDGTVVGFEERGRERMDGSGSYKGKAEGSHSSEGLWIASPARTSLSEAKHIYWFESAYDAMAYYQLFHTQDKELRKAVFVSTGGNPTVEQMRGVLSATLPARQHICFDNDSAGMEFSCNLINELFRTVRSTIEATPERKPYLDSIPDCEDLDCGDIKLLPEALQASFKRFETEQDNGLSARLSGQCLPEEERRQEEAALELYGKFREELREFLGIDSTSDTTYIHEYPDYPHKDWSEQLLGTQIVSEEKELDDLEISGKATLSRALSDLPEVNPAHIRNGLYDKADYEAVRKRLDHADKMIFSFEINDQGMSDKGFQEMYQIREELVRLEKDITRSLSDMREDHQSRFHR